jgi:hypothetical protein
MRWSVAVASLLALTVLSACVAIKFGREFPSPDAKMLVIGRTDKSYLERTFGEPYQVGLDSGDPTWRWFYGQRDSGTELSKDMSIRFNPDGTVKAYSFTSNFPEDMRRLK